MNPIKILGSGPSALSAAINLAKEKFEVHVYEQHEEIGKRFHGDIQGLENWSRREDVLDTLAKMNISINFDCQPSSKIIVSNGSNTKEDITFKRPIYYLVKRGSVDGSFDQGLKDQASSLGVNIHFNSTIPKEEADIIATGPISQELFAADEGLIFKTDMEDMVVAIINDKAAPKGYAYLIVTKGYGCLCTCIFEDFPHLKDYLERAKEMFAKIVDLRIIEKIRDVGGVGCFSTKNIFKEGKALFVGEASGLQDMLWGFGIRNALTSGFLAARSIIEKSDYEKEAKSFFIPRLRASLVNRFLYELFAIGNYAPLINKFKNEQNLFGWMESLHNFNKIQKVIYPLALVYMRKRYPKLRI
ncbi:MAG: NAD(P)/FAD-dependent oxidoreductase [Patescibacteria group bacterium]